MSKNVLFSAMLLLGAAGGLASLPTPVKASTEQAQTFVVTGQVVDQDGEPLIGATVAVKGASGGSVTDIDGNFRLETTRNATLVVSYVGYKDLEVAVNGQNSLGQIKLASDDLLLERHDSACAAVSKHRADLVNVVVAEAGPSGRVQLLAVKLIGPRKREIVHADHLGILRRRNDRRLRRLCRGRRKKPGQKKPDRLKKRDDGSEHLLY